MSPVARTRGKLPWNAENTLQDHISFSKVSQRPFTFVTHTRSCPISLLSLFPPCIFWLCAELRDALLPPAGKHLALIKATLTAQLFATPTAGEAVTSMLFPTAHGLS